MAARHERVRRCPSRRRGLLLDGGHAAGTIAVGGDRLRALAAATDDTVTTTTTTNAVTTPIVSISYGCTKLEHYIHTKTNPIEYLNVVVIGVILLSYL